MSEGNVVERLSRIAGQVGAMDKQQVQNFKAFTVDDVYSKLRPLFAKEGVVVCPQVVSSRYEQIVSNKGTKGTAAFVTVDYVFHADDGSHVTMTCSAEGQDYSDKATNKAVQQAFKYGLIQMFMISTGEVDPDAAVVEPAVVEADHDTQAKLLVLDAAGGDKDAAKSLYSELLETLEIARVNDLSDFRRFQEAADARLTPEVPEIRESDPKAVS